ncbi:rhodanese-like domain-containing protein [Bermanella sp. WJH001]|uniref:rhodanese-like domain-containing protein n=1 Tax=Bermanella sp. WJH001 TaxID=3048005 RepID=UPI0024BD6DAA|nr:rhodanese-like domain-containing protein [Bermanella sp. WJH001]MDJ1537609.1 rhodanese-like domain-containing protein [Bermanella sp. WJH001]
MKLLLAIVLSILTSLSFAQPLLLDVRSQGEYDSGHAHGALLIPHDTINEQAPKLLKDKNQEIKVYCRSGNRAGKAVSSLKAMGYTNVENIGSLKNAHALTVE